MGLLPPLTLAASVLVDLRWSRWILASTRKLWDKYIFFLVMEEQSCCNSPVPYLAPKTEFLF